jgi:hypothetical protein
VGGLAESNTGEPGAVISRMPGSVGGRRKRVRTRGYLAGGLPCGGSRIRQKGTAMPEDAGVNVVAPHVRVREMVCHER